MITKPPDETWLAPTFFENQKKVSPEIRLPFRGLFIAWNWDGNKVLDSADSRKELYAKLSAAGVDLHRVVVEFVEEL